MTRRDLLEGNQDLIDEATRLLALQKPHTMRVEVEPREGRLPLVRIETQHVTRLDVWLDGRPQRSLDVRSDVTVIDLNDIAGEIVEELPYLELRAFEVDQLVMVYRGNLMA